MRLVSNMTDINAVKDQRVLAVTPLLLRCINNFIYCRLLESYPFHSFFIGQTCGISDETWFDNITKPVIQSLKADFITLSHSLFFDHHDKVLFKTTKYKNCKEYKIIQEFIEVQRNNISAHVGDLLHQKKKQSKPHLENHLVTNALIERPNFLGKTKATKEQVQEYFGSYIKKEELMIQNSSYEEYGEVKFAKSEEEKEVARKEVKKLLIDKLHNSTTYTLSLESSMISVMLKLYDEFYETNQELLMLKMGNSFYHKERINFPLLSKIDNNANQGGSKNYTFYLDQFFCEKERIRSDCFYILEIIHKSKLAESITRSFDKGFFKD
ncbi:MAG: hypothetical protein EBS06_06015 [Proteobacteria bacterium]|nr:hypothetical protein [Pseudomonadota bacterium]